MSIDDTLQERSGSLCEICAATATLKSFEVPSSPDSGADSFIYACATCREQFEEAGALDTHHWRCLNDAIWSEVPAVQVMAWRVLTRLSDEDWARELLDMLYLDEKTLAWAQAAQDALEAVDVIIHLDSNGAVLAAGDTVTIIKDLDVKGASFTAKRGTAVRNITLVADNPEHIEGRVNGQRIVILTKFVKKA